MKCTRHTTLTFADREADEPEPSGVLTPGASTQNCLAETTPNPDNTPFQLSSLEASGCRSIKRRSSSPAEVVGDISETCHTEDPVDRKVTGRGPDPDSKDVGHLASNDTVSRSTQTDVGLEWTNERYGNEGILVRVPFRYSIQRLAD